MKKIKAVLIGAGGRGAGSYGPYALQHPEQIEFVAVAEPIASRRQRFCQDHNIPESHAFESYEPLIEAKIEADVALVCTQDQLHLEPTIMSLDAGYHVLLEKPIVQREECIKIEEAVKRTGKNLAICHVLRYTPFFKGIKQIIESGEIGDLVTIHHNEHVGYYHAAHSFVRGTWGNSETSCPMILAKCCHDVDILMWLIGKSCKQVSSFGALKHFKASQAPEGAAKRCVDCGVGETCPYNAVKMYMDEENTGWPVNVITEDFSYEGRMKALREGPYGRCVYYCDNNVVDHQASILEFEDDITVTFQMNAFSHDMNRTLRISGTHGEIIGDMEEEIIEVHKFDGGFGGASKRRVPLDKITKNDYGHGGGDYGLMKALVESLQEPEKNIMESNIDSAVASHIVTFALEEARVKGEVVQVEKN